MNKKDKIIFINQSSELYGSDKTLLDLVVGLKANHNIDPIVILQAPGLLNLELDKHGIEYHYIPVLKVHKKMFTPKYLFEMAKDSVLSIKKLHKIVKENDVKIIYSNSFAVLLGNLYALLYSIKHIWHCHEIILSPKLFLIVYNLLLKSKLVDDVIYNSVATMESWVKNDPVLKSKAHLVYNGIDLNIQPANEDEVKQLRYELFPTSNDQTLIYGNIGRISDRKGIEILIDAFQQIHQENPNTKLLFVGSPTPGKEDFQDKMFAKIERYKLTDHVKFVPFVNNVFPYWQTMDIAVIPSKEPEPFGLVAIEAMLVKKPIVAADHGGLAEIVEHQSTGLKFRPNDLSDLVQKLKELSHQKETIHTYGENGYQRVHQLFDLNNYINGIATICKKYLK